MHKWIKRGALAVAGVATATLALTSCAPGPDVWPLMTAQGNVLDSFGNRVLRLTIKEQLQVRSDGFVVRNSGTASHEAIGWNGGFSGTTLEAVDRNPTDGPVGPFTQIAWFDSYQYTGDWHLQVAVTVYGYGFHIGKGDCTVYGYFGVNPSKTDGGAAYVYNNGSDTYCTQLNSRTETGASVPSQALSDHDKWAYTKLPADGKKLIDQIVAKPLNIQGQALHPRPAR